MSFFWIKRYVCYISATNVTDTYINNIGCFHYLKFIASYLLMKKCMPCEHSFQRFSSNESG